MLASFGGKITKNVQSKFCHLREARLLLNMPHHPVTASRMANPPRATNPV